MFFLARKSRIQNAKLILHLLSATFSANKYSFLCKENSGFSICWNDKPNKYLCASYCQEILHPWLSLPTALLFLVLCDSFLFHSWPCALCFLFSLFVCILLQSCGCFYLALSQKKTRDNKTKTKNSIYHKYFIEEKSIIDTFIQSERESS